MEETKYSRKLEQNGRILIPVKLRDEMKLVAGREYQFFIHEQDGHKFICIDCGEPQPEVTLEQIVQMAQTYGMKVVRNDS